MPARPLTHDQPAFHLPAADAGFGVDRLPTPAVVIDAATVRGNIERLAVFAAAHGIAVRPHTKTHKSIDVARLQLAAGAHGLTVAKVG